MSLSILIPTHKREHLFERCILSAIKNCPVNTEIIVSDDIGSVLKENICKKYNVNYIINKTNLNDVYFNLIKISNKKYIYFLEDDDILLPGFKDIDLNCEISIYNYIHENSPINGKLYNDGIIDYQSFFKYFKGKLEYEFQLSQIVFQKDLLDMNKLPTEIHIHNDVKLFKCINFNYINTYNKFIFKQTTDGKDNISFEIFNR